VATAGAFVLLTYFANPTLLAVRSPDVQGVLRTANDGHRERAFLACLMGLDLDVGGVLGGGIHDAEVRRLAEGVNERHRAFPGMTDAYMRHIAGLLALAPLRVRRLSGNSPVPTTRTRYWRYATRAMGLFAVELGGLRSVERDCAHHDQLEAALSSDGSELIGGFAERHPDHVSQALPVLFPRARAAVRAALAGNNLDLRSGVDAGGGE